MTAAEILVDLQIDGPPLRRVGPRFERATRVKVDGGQTMAVALEQMRVEA